MINAEMNGFILVSDAGDEERSTFELCNERYIHIIWIVLNGLILLTIIALYSLARWRNKNPKVLGDLYIYIYIYRTSTKYWKVNPRSEGRQGHH